MKHAHVDRLERIYSHFANGNIPGVLDECSPQITFQIAGKSRLAGKYDRQSFQAQFVPMMRELSGGTFKIEVHDILASDRHAVVLATEHLTKKGTSVEFRTVHVWRFESGLPVAWYEYPRDLYQFDAIWS